MNDLEQSSCSTSSATIATTSQHNVQVRVVSGMNETQKMLMSLVHRRYRVYDCLLLQRMAVRDLGSSNGRAQSYNRSLSLLIFVQWLCQCERQTEYHCTLHNRKRLMSHWFVVLLVGHGSMRHQSTWNQNEQAAVHATSWYFWPLQHQRTRQSRNEERLNVVRFNKKFPSFHIDPSNMRQIHTHAHDTFVRISFVYIIV